MTPLMYFMIAVCIGTLFVIIITFVIDVVLPYKRYYNDFIIEVNGDASNWFYYTIKRKVKTITFFSIKTEYEDTLYTFLELNKCLDLLNKKYPKHTVKIKKQ